MADFTFKITGLEQALGRMKTLRTDIPAKAVVIAARKAMEPVKAAAIAGAKRFDDPETSRSIAENIVIATKNNYRKGYVVAKVGVQGGARLGTKLAVRDNKKTREKGTAGQEYTVAHWRLLEFGTVNMRAQPFMRPALAENVDKVVDRFVASLNPAIDKALLNAARATARAATKAAG